MKVLNRSQCECVSAGCGPGMFDGLIHGLVITFGCGLVAAFALGVGFMVLYQRMNQPPAVLAKK